MNSFLGTIQPFAFNFAPRGWMFCNGQLLPIKDYNALFALLGTTYGGNGQTTFALPDLRGRVSISQGQGPGLSDYEMGEIGGRETVTLLTSNMPIHNHSITASNSAGTSATPIGMVPAVANAFDPGSGNAVTANVYTNTANATMNAATIGVAGGSQPFSVIQPFLTVNFCICTEGLFPSRN